MMRAFQPFAIFVDRMAPVGRHANDLNTQDCPLRWLEKRRMFLFYSGHQPGSVS